MIRYDVLSYCLFIYFFFCHSLSISFKTNLCTYVNYVTAVKTFGFNLDLEN